MLPPRVIIMAMCSHLLIDCVLLVPCQSVQLIGKRSATGGRQTHDREILLGLLQLVAQPHRPDYIPGRSSQVGVHEGWREVV